MLVIDREGVVVFANPAADRLLGREVRALDGTRLGFPLVPGESGEIDVVAVPTARTGEMRVIAVDWEGKPAALASLRDVTERKRTEDEPRRLPTELELRVSAHRPARSRRGRTRSFQLLRLPRPAGLAAAIHGFARMLEDQLGDDLPAAAGRSMERVMAGAEKMGNLIDEVLKLSRLGRQLLAQTTVDLNALAHEIVAELRSAHPEQLAAGMPLRRIPR